MLKVEKGQLNITVQAQPNSRYQVEIFANQQKNANEAEQYLGQAVVVTDAQGKANTTWKITEKAASMTATVTDINGSTSELSKAVNF